MFVVSIIDADEHDTDPYGFETLEEAERFAAEVQRMLGANDMARDYLVSAVVEVKPTTFVQAHEEVRAVYLYEDEED